jgi:hypothetical protein
MSLLFGDLGQEADGSPPGTALSFLPVWLAMAVVNMWVGVAHAGYTVRQELPILTLVILIPALAADAVIRRLAR